MNEHDIRFLIDEVKAGRVSRRSFIQTLVGVGLTLPMAGQILLHAGVAHARTRPAYKPTKRGGGGTVKLLMWQGPTLLNPHFAVGTKDQFGSRVFYEPLANWDADGNLVPILAAEIPSVANGGVAKDGKSVTWKLKKGVTWHDGKPFTADDCIFNVEYAQDPETSTTTIAAYRDVKAVKIDSHTVRLEFKEPTPFWADALVGTNGMIIPKHHFDAYRGSKSRDAPANLKPVGTGPYKYVDFKPGDMLRGAMNPTYHEANRPSFDAMEMKGGGDAVSAARAVLQTGEFDYAWNMQVQDEILKNLEKGGKGRITIEPGGGIEFLQFNATDPWTEVDGERASYKTKHPTLTDFAVRDAINYLVDRQSIQDHIYGRTGIATRNFVNNPTRFRSPNTKTEFSIDKANKVLDAAGWKRASDGIRGRDGKKLKYVFQTSINDPRQKCQAIIKQACQKAGIDIELKSIPASVFFSSDVGNPDTFRKFYADLQMYNTTMPRPDPETFTNQFLSSEIASKENKWASTNNTRWHSDEYDATWKAAKTELDPVKRAAMFIKCNEILIENRVIVPIVNRPTVAALSNKLSAEMTGWDNDVFLLKDWYRTSDKYILRRLLIAIPSLIGISIILFGVLALAPGDPFEELATNPNVPPEVRMNLRAKFGLDDPIPVRYVRWAGSMVKGDWGFSFVSRVNVDELILGRLPTTLAVIGLSQLLALLVAIPVGVIAATRPYSIFDQLANTFAFIGFSLPTFFTGLLFILFFSIYLDWLPFVYRADLSETGMDWWWAQFKQSIMPIAVLGLFQGASWTRYVRASVLDVIRLDYITTARSKGLAERWVVIKHALRNALIPVVTLVALQMPAIFGGAIVTEQIFRVPGIGSLLISSILANDTPVIMAVTFVFACLVIFFNLLADALYGWLDPRISYR